MFLGALSGFTIAVTADRRAEEQAELIARRGGEVLLGPVIRTLPLGGESGLVRSTEALIADPPELVVLSTALGVRGWFSGAEGLGLDGDLLESLGRAEVLVRGPKARGASLTAGLEVDWSAPNATYAEVIEYLSPRPTPTAPRCGWHSNSTARPGRCWRARFAISDTRSSRCRSITGNFPRISVPPNAS
jgi:uroporphyrinogen-III synthase